MKKEYLDITGSLSVEKFQTIAAIILKDGDRSPYCNKYNNSPHYKVDSFHVYLNPVSQFINWSVDDLSVKVSDYNTIVIQDFNNDIKYYHLILKEDNLVLLDCRDQKDCAYMKKLFLSNYLPAIEIAFNLNK